MILADKDVGLRDSIGSEGLTFTIRLVGRDTVLPCPAGRTLLEASRRSEGTAAIPSGCRGGGCGVCRVQVLEGLYSCDRMSRRQVPAEDEARGFALACQLYPQSDLLVGLCGKRE
ncbi:Na(+)-translocating NADH-quinone reductase subunit F (plasmid) [Sphingobium sp. AntQ-1]|uniref:2Fe-2S iron-sulfur cluster binding domain-containing protein n=1 Tax=Sphingobium sp. AntQ-1 TaxID=2930091 RepID=UPI00234EFDF5|nr:2Fe-2S iron-sulfur cluster binding domain-containing protein [Sphingobium sp. AntQ-1]WCP15974.1 Na(+)-translocating NADH-quinone reductase subunit F [Sphingobium sp. AntQ-1]